LEQRNNWNPVPDIIGTSQSNCAYAIKFLSEKRGEDVLGDFVPVPIAPSHAMHMATGILKLFHSSQRDG
jgi:hypothetical protein